jgi:hypothetical protein
MMSVKVCAELVEACALRQAQGTIFAGPGHITFDRLRAQPLKVSASAPVGLLSALRGPL